MPASGGGYFSFSVGGGGAGGNYVGEFTNYAALVANDDGSLADGSVGYVLNDTGSIAAFLTGISGARQAGYYVKVDGTWTRSGAGVDDVIRTLDTGLPNAPDSRDATTDYILRVSATDDGGAVEFVQQLDAVDGTLPEAPTDEGRYALDIDDSENASWTTVVTGHTIQSAGTDLTTRANLNFTGGLEATDDSVNDQSDISISDGGVDTDQLADDAVTLAKMDVNSVDSDQYVDGSIDAVHLSDDSVTTEKIEDEAVTPEKLDNFDDFDLADDTGSLLKIFKDADDNFSFESTDIQFIRDGSERQYVFGTRPDKSERETLVAFKQDVLNGFSVLSHVWSEDLGQALLNPTEYAVNDLEPDDITLNVADGNLSFFITTDGGVETEYEIAGAVASQSQVFDAISSHTFTNDGGLPVNFTVTWDDGIETFSVAGFRIEDSADLFGYRVVDTSDNTDLFVFSTSVDSLLAGTQFETLTNITELDNSQVVPSPINYKDDPADPIADRSYIFTQIIDIVNERMADNIDNLSKYI